MKINAGSKKILVPVTSLILGILLSYREFDLYLFSTWRYPESSSSILLLAMFIFVFFSSQSFTLIWINILWKKELKAQKKFLISFLITIGFCILGSIIVILFNESSHLINRLLDGRHQDFFETIISLIIRSISILIIVFTSAWVYNLSSKKLEAEKKYETLKFENLQSQLQALNNQINPHFFFNALNSLHSLILEDKKDKSLLYLANISNIFRYILQSEKKGLVKLKDELDFLDIYQFTLFVKYEKKLDLKVQIEERYKDYKIPVLSLLPVIENVSKHNEISNKYPMLITIKVEDEMLVIQNNKRDKIDIVQSEGVGLNNLNKRFKLLMDKKIQIDNAESFFTIYLPLKND